MPKSKSKVPRITVGIFLVAALLGILAIIYTYREVQSPKTDPDEISLGDAGQQEEDPAQAPEASVADGEIDSEESVGEKASQQEVSQEAAEASSAIELERGESVDAEAEKTEPAAILLDSELKSEPDSEDPREESEAAVKSDAVAPDELESEKSWETAGKDDADSVEDSKDGSPVVAEEAPPELDDSREIGAMVPDMTSDDPGDAASGELDAVEEAQDAPQEDAAETIGKGDADAVDDSKVGSPVVAEEAPPELDDSREIGAMVPDMTSDDPGDAASGELDAVEEAQDAPQEDAAETIGKGDADAVDDSKVGSPVVAEEAPPELDDSREIGAMVPDMTSDDPRDAASGELDAAEEAQDAPQEDAAETIGKEDADAVDDSKVGSPVVAEEAPPELDDSREIGAMVPDMTSDDPRDAASGELDAAEEAEAGDKEDAAETIGKEDADAVDDSKVGSPVVAEEALPELDDSREIGAMVPDMTSDDPRDAASGELDAVEEAQDAPQEDAAETIGKGDADAVDDSKVGSPVVAEKAPPELDDSREIGSMVPDMTSDDPRDAASGELDAAEEAEAGDKEDAAETIGKGDADAVDDSKVGSPVVAEEAPPELDDSREIGAMVPDMTSDDPRDAASGELDAAEEAEAGDKEDAAETIGKEDADAVDDSKVGSPVVAEEAPPELDDSREIGAMVPDMTSDDPRDAASGELDAAEEAEAGDKEDAAETIGKEDADAVDDSKVGSPVVAEEAPPELDDSREIGAMVPDMTSDDPRDAASGELDAAEEAEAGDKEDAAETIGKEDADAVDDSKVGSPVVAEEAPPELDDSREIGAMVPDMTSDDPGDAASGELDAAEEAQDAPQEDAAETIGKEDADAVDDSKVGSPVVAEEAPPELDDSREIGAMVPDMTSDDPGDAASGELDAVEEAQDAPKEDAAETIGKGDADAVVDSKVGLPVVAEEAPSELDDSREIGAMVPDMTSDDPGDAASGELDAAEEAEAGDKEDAAETIGKEDADAVDDSKVGSPVVAEEAPPELDDSREIGAMVPDMTSDDPRDAASGELDAAEEAEAGDKEDAAETAGKEDADAVDDSKVGSPVVAEEEPPESDDSREIGAMVPDIASDDPGDAASGELDAAEEAEAGDKEDAAETIGKEDAVDDSKVGSPVVAEEAPPELDDSREIGAMVPDMTSDDPRDAASGELDAAEEAEAGDKEDAAETAGKEDADAVDDSKVGSPVVAEEAPPELDDSREIGAMVPDLTSDDPRDAASGELDAAEEAEAGDKEDAAETIGKEDADAVDDSKVGSPVVAEEAPPELDDSREIGAMVPDLTSDDPRDAASGELDAAEEAEAGDKEDAAETIGKEDADAVDDSKVGSPVVAEEEPPESDDSREIGAMVPDIASDDPGDAASGELDAAEEAEAGEKGDTAETVSKEDADAVDDLKDASTVETEEEPPASDDSRENGAMVPDMTSDDPGDAASGELDAVEEAEAGEKEDAADTAGKKDADAVDDLIDGLPVVADEEPPELHDSRENGAMVPEMTSDAPGVVASSELNIVEKVEAAPNGDAAETAFREDAVAVDDTKEVASAIAVAETPDSDDSPGNALTGFNENIAEPEIDNSGEIGAVESDKTSPENSAVAVLGDAVDLDRIVQAGDTATLTPEKIDDSDIESVGDEENDDDRESTEQETENIVEVKNTVPTEDSADAGSNENESGASITSKLELEAEVLIQDLAFLDIELVDPKPPVGSQIDEKYFTLEPPSFDIVRVDKFGTATVAGRATPGSRVDVLVRGNSLSNTVADASGQFAVTFDVEITLNPIVISLLMKIPGRPELKSLESVVVVVPQESPFVPEADPDLPPAIESIKSPAIMLASPDSIELVQPGFEPESNPNSSDNVTIDAIYYDEDGEVVLAGRGGPGKNVIVYVDGKPEIQEPVGLGGEWSLPLTSVDAGRYTLRIDEVDDFGIVYSRVETPFQKELPEIALQRLETVGQTSEPGSPPRVIDDFEIRSITVQPGYTLWGISRSRFGLGRYYVRIYAANKEQIRDPDLIYPGQVFIIPD